MDTASTSSNSDIIPVNHRPIFGTFGSTSNNNTTTGNRQKSLITNQNQNLKLSKVSSNNNSLGSSQRSKTYQNVNNLSSPSIQKKITPMGSPYFSKKPPLSNNLHGSSVQLQILGHANNNYSHSGNNNTIISKENRSFSSKSQNSFLTDSNNHSNRTDLPRKSIHTVPRNVTKRPQPSIDIGEEIDQLIRNNSRILMEDFSATDSSDSETEEYVSSEDGDHQINSHHYKSHASLHSLAKSNIGTAVHQNSSPNQSLSKRSMNQSRGSINSISNSNNNNSSQNTTNRHKPRYIRRSNSNNSKAKHKVEKIYLRQDRNDRTKYQNSHNLSRDGDLYSQQQLQTQNGQNVNIDNLLRNDQTTNSNSNSDLTSLSNISIEQVEDRLNRLCDLVKDFKNEICEKQEKMVRRINVKSNRK